MYEKVKNVLCFIGVIAILFAGIYFWTLFRSRVQDNGNPADNVRNALDDAHREQQSATDAVGRIESGIERSEGILSGLEEGNRSSQETIRRIEQANRRIEDAISGYEERLGDSEDLLRENQRRLEDCLRTIQIVRATNQSKD